MYSSTEPSAVQQSGPKSLLGAFHSMWRLMAVVMFYWLMQWGTTDFLTAFTRSIVVCSPPVHVDGECPVGSQPGATGACEAVPKSSRNWSGSAHCADKLYVTATGTATAGKIVSAGNCAMILSQVFVGAAMLDTLGRKPVLLMGLASTTLFTGVLWFSCHLPSNMALSAILLGSVVSKLSDSFAAATAAMITDLSHGCKHAQGLGFSAVNILKHVGIILAFGSGFPVLSLYLEDYTMVWGAALVLSCAAVTVAAVVLQETCSGSAMALLFDDGGGLAGRPEQLEGGSGAGAGGAGAAGAGGGGGGVGGGAVGGEKVPKALQMVNVMAETGNAFKVVWEDAFLRRCVQICFLRTMSGYGSIAIFNGFALEIIRLRQQVVSLGGVIQPLAIVLGSYSAVHLLDDLGEAGTFLLGLSIEILGLVTIGACAHFRHQAILLYWTGMIILGVGFGLTEPSFNKLLALRIRPGRSGKVFSVKMFMDTLGQALGAYVWTNFLFGSEDGGDWWSGIGFFVSAGGLLLASAGTSALYAVHLRGEK